MNELITEVLKIKTAIDSINLKGIENIELALYAAKRCDLLIEKIKSVSSKLSDKNQNGKKMPIGDDPNG